MCSVVAAGRRAVQGVVVLTPLPRLWLDDDDDDEDTDFDFHPLGEMG